MIAINITHDDDNAVGLLAMAMVTKLAKARAKGRSGWDAPECTQQHLSDLLREHVAKGDPVDVANFCAFLTARGEGIAPRQSPAQIEKPPQPVAEICSASHDAAEFGERAIKPLRDISGFEYGTPLYAGAAPAAAVPQVDLDADLGRTVDQRDTAEGWADGLAGLIGKYFGRDIGEHSSAHCPWEEARDIIEEAAPYKHAAVAEPAPAGWQLVPATPTREWIASVADGGYEDCDCASLIADILSRAPTAPALEAPAAPDLRKTRDKAGILHYLTPEQMAEEIVRLDARLAAAPQAPAAPEAVPQVHPFETAPKDGTIVRLLVQFVDHPPGQDNVLNAAGPLYDTEGPCWTIGGNTAENTSENLWQFVGWNWQQDCFEDTSTDAGHRVLGWAPFDVAAPAAPAVDAAAEFPAMTDELASILGMMCFQCISFAQALRAGGQSIKNRAEDEQAAVLHWMLGHYFRAGPEGWRAAAAADMERMRDAVQTKEGGE